MNEKLNKRYTSEELQKLINSTKELMWVSAPDWAIGILEYKSGGRYWISNDGLQLKEIAIKNMKDTDVVKWFQYLADAELLDLLEYAWGIIANAYGGEWTEASKSWETAAYSWRNRYGGVLKKIALQNQENYPDVFYEEQRAALMKAKKEINVDDIGEFI